MENQMTARTPAPGTTQELDVRGMRKPDKHPTIFATFAALPVGESFVLVNDHDPQHLRDEFDSDFPRGYDWTYLNRETRDWRIRITKLAATALPRVLVNTADMAADDHDPEGSGALWKLQVRERDLDSNIIAIPPDGSIDAHNGPDLDVIIHVLAGSGELITECDTVDLSPGALVFLPRRSRREFAAGPQGLRYFTVHQRRQALTLEPPSPA